MTFHFSFAGVQVSISSSATSSDKESFHISSVRHCEGRIEADVSNFSGTIVISEEFPKHDEGAGNDLGVVVDGVPGEGEGRPPNANQAGVIETERKTPKAGDEMQAHIPNLENDNARARPFPQSECLEGPENGEPGGVGQLHNIMVASTGVDVVVNAIPEPQVGGVLCVENGKSKMEHESSSSSTANSSNPLEGAPEPYVCPIVHQASHLTVEIDSDDDPEKAVPSPTTPNGRVSFDLANTQVLEEPEGDLRLHEACASDEADIEDLRALLSSHPELASVRDKFGDYPAHLFANNDAFIYTSCDEDVRQFLVELYTACPAAFLAEGYSGQIPFAEAIVDWVDDCHTVYESARAGESPNNEVFSRGANEVFSRGRASDASSVYRVSEIKALTKSTRVISSLCVRDEVQRLVQLPSHVALPVKVSYSFQMLSFLLDAMGRTALDDLSTRREFWAVASKRRDGIIGSVASLPFLVRTILLVEDRRERNALLDLSIVRNIMFRPESVDLWLVALLSGGDRARACATDYLCIVSHLSLSKLFGGEVPWGNADAGRFRHARSRLYDAIGGLAGFLPVTLHLGDALYEVSTKRVMKHVVESVVGRPLPVYKKFMEAFLLLILMTSYRIVVELGYAINNDNAMPSGSFAEQHRELWALGLSISSYFLMHDMAVLLSLSSTEERLAMRYAKSFHSMVGYATTTSVIAVLSMLYMNYNVMGMNYIGIVTGLLWWRFALHVKTMSQNFSTLWYTIMQIAAMLKYFLAIFVIAIFFFADMVDIVKKTSGECDGADGDMDLEAFCSLTPLQSYLAMYGVLIGGVEISSLEGSSALVSILFVAASFCGVIVLVNILIAIVTGEYEKAQQRSCRWFARARLEAAVEHVANENVWNPPDDPNSGIARKLWRLFAKAKYTALLIAVEIFLVQSLLSCASLNKDGILGDFLYVALILCAILYHLFVAAACTYIFAKHICKSKGMKWLRRSKFHIALLKLCLKPVLRYIQMVGLGGADCNREVDEVDKGDHPLTHDEFSRKQADFENNIQEALKDTESRILNALFSGDPDPGFEDNH